jgi:hypothetical protein
MAIDVAIPVYLEIGAKRTFASAIEWPGWSRAGRDEEAALAAFVAAGSRYVAAMSSAGDAIIVPATTGDVEIVDRLPGGSGTDFGVPSLPAPGDQTTVDPGEAARLAAILEASWRAFDRAAAGAVGVELTKGPRGGGRDLDKIVDHVWQADIAYHQSLGHRYVPEKGARAPDDMARLRVSALEAFRSRVADEPLPPSRRTSAPWSPRYYVRRAAWHALDHAWEIEDRAVDETP